MDTGYPVILTKVGGALAVVVGGGAVGERKVKGLLAVGTSVRLISPEATQQLRALAAEGRITWEQRPYGAGDLHGAQLAFAATDHREVNAQVADDAAGLGLLCNVADAPDEGNFHLPAVHREAGLVIAVSTGGESPTRARQVRDRIAAWLAEEAQVTGKAYLVGAGPGRADLITVRGLEVLRRADVVLHDRLIARELLDEVPPHAEVVFVGKAAGHHVKTQDAINELIVNRVRMGKRVVRLKGGDPFVFGRGGEEALALAEAGLPFEVVPGVTSAIAVPAFAGVPVTHRGLSTAFAVVTGHESPDKPDKSTTDWQAMARIPTLVIMMATKRLDKTCQALIEAGRDPDTPAVAIGWGTTDCQEVARATLGTLCEVVEGCQLPTPALVVIGEVAALADDLSWFRPDGGAAGFVPLPESTPVRQGE